MAVVNLNELLEIVPARSIAASDTIEFEVSAGKTLKLETAPDGDDLASGTVPSGKKWIGKWNITFEEVDA